MGAARPNWKGLHPPRRGEPEPPLVRPGQKFTAAEKFDLVDKWMREETRLAPKRVARGRLSQRRSDYRLAVMVELRADLEAAARREAMEIDRIVGSDGGE